MRRYPSSVLPFLLLALGVVVAIGDVMCPGPVQQAGAPRHLQPSPGPRGLAGGAHVPGDLVLPGRMDRDGSGSWGLAPGEAGSGGRRLAAGPAWSGESVCPASLHPFNPRLNL